MIDNFKEPYNNNNTLENILQNKDYYKLLSKTAYKKHQDIIENDIKYTPYKYDSELSTNTEKVFYKPDDEIVIAHSGTNFRSKNIFNDLKADASVLFGLENQNERFKNSQNHLNKVKNKYGDKYKYISTGHSLGGSVSSNLAKYDPNIYSIGFNRFSGALQSFRKRPKTYIDISNRNDPLSYFSRSGSKKNNIINNKGWHSI